MTDQTCTCAYCARRSTKIDRVNDRLANEEAQRTFLGDVSHMWIRRRARDPKFRFPDAVYNGRRPFRWLSDLAAWVESPHARAPSVANFR